MMRRLSFRNRRRKFPSTDNGSSEQGLTRLLCKTQTPKYQKCEDYDEEDAKAWETEHQNCWSSFREFYSDDPLVRTGTGTEELQLEDDRSTREEEAEIKTEDRQAGMGSSAAAKKSSYCNFTTQLLCFSAGSFSFEDDDEEQSSKHTESTSDTPQASFPVIAESVLTLPVTSDISLSSEVLSTGNTDFEDRSAPSTVPPSLEPEIELEVEPATEFGSLESQIEFGVEPETEVRAEPEIEVVVEPETEVRAEPEIEVVAEPETEVRAEPEIEVVVEPETEAVVEKPSVPVPVPPKRARFADEAGHSIIERVIEIEKITVKRLMVMLLLPAERRFELLHISYEEGDLILVKDIVDQFHEIATDPLLKEQKYAGLACRRQNPETGIYHGTELSLVTCIQRCKLVKNEVLVAITEDYTVDELMFMATKLLHHKRVRKAVRQGHASKRAEKRLESHQRRSKKSASKSYQGEMFIGAPPSP